MLEKCAERAVELLEQVKDVTLLDAAVCDKIDAIADSAFEKAKAIKR